MSITTEAPQPARTAPPRLLTLSEAAEYLGVSRKWAYRHAASGDFPTVRLGRGPRAPVRVNPRALRDWLDAGNGP